MTLHFHPRTPMYEAILIAASQGMYIKYDCKLGRAVAKKVQMDL